MREIINETELTRFERKAIAIIKVAFEKENLSFDSINLERRSADYLTLVCPDRRCDGHDTDFCRLKAGPASTWVSLDVWVSKTLQEDYRFSDEKHRNCRHWKIKLFDVESISEITDLIIADYQYNAGPSDYSFNPIIKEVPLKISPKNISDYTVFDLETTGVSSHKRKIVELSALKVRNNDIVDAFSTLVNPKCHIPSEATEVNHITDDMVKDVPVIEDVFDSFMDFLGDDVLIGHNISCFDYVIVSDICKKLKGKPLQNSYIDTYSLARRYLPYVKNHRLSTLAEHFGIEVINAHRAESDCYVTHKLYQAIKYIDISTFEKLEDKFARDTDVECKCQILDIDFKVEISNKTICLTGEFSCGDREQLLNVLKANGAIIKNNISKKLDYLVIGSLGSADWKDGKGSKRLKAEEYNQKGGKITIIEESNFIAERE